MTGGASLDRARDVRGGPSGRWRRTPRGGDGYWQNVAGSEARSSESVR